MSERTLRERLDDMRRYDYADSSLVHDATEALVRRAAEVADEANRRGAFAGAAILADAGLEERDGE